jgi:DUF1365 family protein
MKSALYAGRVRHRRYSPVPHGFSYAIFQVYLDLAELDTVFQGRWLWSASRPAVARFRRSDHLGDPSTPLDVAVRDLVEASGRPRPDGPIRLLTHLRYFGYVMNPVSFYYCFDADDTRVRTIVAEVNNTPWGERHCYILAVGDGGRVSRVESRKAFHVSPFMSMDMSYAWRLSAPGDRLSVHMTNLAAGERVFDATLTLSRVPMTGWHLARVLAAYPLMTAKVIAAIYWQALRLWWKGVPSHPHPRYAAARSAAAHEPGRSR